MAPQATSSNCLLPAGM